MNRKLVIALVVAVVAVLAVVGGTALYAKIQNDKAPEELSLSPTDDASAATDEPAAPPLAVEDLAGDWTVAPTSQAGYRVDEVLNGQDVTVVGRTEDVTGTLTVEGTELTAAEVTVDMTTVTTDSDSRDGQFLDILKTEDFPTATFTLTNPVDVEGITEGVVSGEASGALTIAGQTQSVTVALEAQVTPEGTVEVSGQIPVTFSDYGIEAPDLGFVKVEDTGAVEMLLVLTR